MRVYIVDDDLLVRTTLEFRLEAMGHAPVSFASAVEFLRTARSLQPGCVILDIHMPDIDGLAVQARLKEQRLDFPIVMLTGHADVGIAVRAMKAGALDFLEKPFSESAIGETLLRAARRLALGQAQQANCASARAALARLTPRERDVFDALVEGLRNKAIARRLGISPRTVELHRIRVMDKTEVSGLSDLVRLALAAGVSGAAAEPAGAGS
jgi:two-component system response regulator FixJ